MSQNSQALEAVNVISIVALAQTLFGDNWCNIDYETECEALKKWCAENNAHYYGKPREDFSELEARQEAISLGKPIVVVEDMS